MIGELRNRLKKINVTFGALTNQQVSPVRYCRVAGLYRDGNLIGTVDHWYNGTLSINCHTHIDNIMPIKSIAEQLSSELQLRYKGNVFGCDIYRV